MHYSLLYISRVVQPHDNPNTEQLDAIREQSIELNQANGLTGLLLCSQEHFCQILQGQKSAVEDTMLRIARDSRHVEPIVLLRTDLAEALFPDWSMATSLVEDAAIASQIAGAYNDRLADLNVVDGIIGLMQQFQLSSRYKTLIVYSRTGLDQQLATLAGRDFSNKPIEQVLQLGCSLFNGCALVLLLQTSGVGGHYLKSCAGIEPQQANSLIRFLLLDQSNGYSDQSEADGEAVNLKSVNVKIPGSGVYKVATGCEITTTIAPLPNLAFATANDSGNSPVVIGSLWALSEAGMTDTPAPAINNDLFRLAVCLESLLETKLQSHANELLRQTSRRQQISLAASNRRQEIVMNVASSAIIALDRDCRVLIINDAARKLFGLASEPVPFHWLDSIVFLDPWSLEPLPGASCPVYLAANKKSAPVAEPRSPESSHTQALGGAFSDTFGSDIAEAEAPDPSDPNTDSNVNIVALQINESEPLRYLRVASSMIDEPESAISGVVVFDDVTELQHNRERIRRSDRLEALGHLTGGIAHDFNNLLSTIQSSVELATIERSDEARQSFLDIALDGVQRGADLTDKLVAFAVARPATARAHQLKDILQSVAELVTASIEQDINFVIEDVPESLAVHCDGGQLENALLNVLLNSRDAIYESGIGDTVTIRVRSTESAVQTEAAKKISITVTDNGPGMNAEVIRRATDPFFTTRSGGSGSGLGLSMVYRFVEQSGGELLIENLSDRDPDASGVRVTLLLEQTTAQPVPEDHADTTKPQIPPPHSQAKVLLVEDETSLAEMLRQSLNRFGFDTRVVHSADKALKVLHSDDSIDLLLTDIVMPGGDMDGYSLAAEAIRFNPQLKVVYLSGYPQQSGKITAIAYGPLIKKPVSMKSLISVIRTELGQRSSSAVLEAD